MANFVKCEIPKGFRLNTYGENQKLIVSFAEAGIECAKVTDFVGDVRSLPSRLTRCAKNLKLMHIKAMKFGNDVYLINTLVKENADGT